MHRTQIYLPEELYEKIKTRSKITGLSQSELIRRAVEKDLQQEDSKQSAREFFNQFQPLTSFSGCEPEEYVRTLRSNSRIFKDN